MRTGYVVAEPLRGSYLHLRHGKRFYEIRVKQVRKTKVVRGTTVIEDETIVSVRQSGFTTTVRKDDDILRVYGLLVSYISKAQELSIETGRFLYTITAVYEGGQYIPLKQ